MFPFFRRILIVSIVSGLSFVSSCTEKKAEEPVTSDTATEIPASPTAPEAPAVPEAATKSTKKPSKKPHKKK
jgi:hypothetical protein